MNASESSREQMSASFSFLTSHSHVLLLIARQPDVRMKELAQSIGITERAVQTIVRELTAAGYLLIVRVGRRNRYEIVSNKQLWHPSEHSHTVGSLISRLIERCAPKSDAA